MAQKQRFNRWFVAAIVVFGSLLHAYVILSDAYDMDPVAAPRGGQVQE